MKVTLMKEILGIFYSSRFIVLFFVSSCMFALNGIFSVEKISNQNDDYSEYIASIDRYKSTIITEIKKTPSQMSFVCEGGDKYRPYSYSLGSGGSIISEEKRPRNDKFPDMWEVDWVTIIILLYSLSALILGYNMISGEIENKTLGLILSNSISRYRILISKYCSILLCLSIPLLFGMFVSYLIIGLSLPEILSFYYFSLVLVFFLLSLAFLSIFIFTSLLVSSFIHDSTLSIFVLVIFWIILFFIPATSNMVIKLSQDLPREYQLAREQNLSFSSSSDALKSFSNRIKSGEFSSESEILNEGEKILLSMQRNLEKKWKDYKQSIQKQVNKTRFLARISPIAQFRFSSAELMGTGHKQHVLFTNDIQNYSIIYNDYIHKKLGKIIPYFKYNAAWYIENNGKFIEIRTPRPIEYDGDKSDFPIFQQTSSLLGDGLRESFVELFGLLLWNLALSVSCFFVFEKCDIR